MLRWTKLGGGNKDVGQLAVAAQPGQPPVGADGLTDQERQALEDMDRFYGMENVSAHSVVINVCGEGSEASQEKGARSRPTPRSLRGHRQKEAQGEHAGQGRAWILSRQASARAMCVCVDEPGDGPERRPAVGADGDVRARGRARVPSIGA